VNSEQDLEGQDPELAAFVASVSKAQDQALEGSPVLPDFAEVVSRAHAMDPRKVPAGKLEGAQELASVIPLHGASASQTTMPDGEFCEFLADVRAEGIRESAQHLDTRDIPAIQVPDNVVVRGRGVRLVSGLVALCAVAAVVFLFASGTGVRLLQSTADQTPSNALREAAVQPHEQSVEMRNRVPRTKPKPVAPDEPALPEPLEEQPEDLEPTKIDPPAVSPTDRPQRPAKSRSKPDPLAELDTQAQAKWRAGDLAGAEGLLRKVIEKGHRGRRVQLAYGDLFTLVRQLHPGAGEEQLWREYLRAFPHGTHADDARAGLCRRATDDVAASCWRDYLKNHPRGAHRRQAQTLVAQPTDAVGEGL